MERTMQEWEAKQVYKEFVVYFRNHNLIPIVGAGLSAGAETENGIVPNGKEYMEHMIEMLCENNGFTQEEKDRFTTEKFSALCDYYEDDENVLAENRLEYLKNNFYKVNMRENDFRKRFFDIGWPYIYSLNIDDAIENTSEYKRIILPNRDFYEQILDEEKCIIKMHGDIREIVTYKKSDKIFTSKEYSLSIEKNIHLLKKLRNDYECNNIVYIGCSLEDEMDLKILSQWNIGQSEFENLSRTFIFIVGHPSKTQKSRFKIYGITDVVCFSKYEEMYTFLKAAWDESQKIQSDQLDAYRLIRTEKIGKEDKKRNMEYFLWQKSLYNHKERTLVYPYYFTARNLTISIMSNLSKNKVHLVYGGCISGKSYLLADIYYRIKDREVFYFDGRERLSKQALTDLLGRKDMVALLDSGTLIREQFEVILQNANVINKNSSNIILILNRSDSDAMGIIKWKLNKGLICAEDIISYNISNKLQETGCNEVKSINGLLPYIDLIPYTNQRTFLDQVIYVEEQLSKPGKFHRICISPQNEKQLALLITLAIKEKLYSYDVINLGFEKEIGEALKKYTPFIECVEVDEYEKKNSDLSNYKYILNSKYWLRRELGNFARVKENDELICSAYQYIIYRIKQASGNDENKQRKICRDYILFDVMNDIFLDEYRGNITLIMHVYKKLHELLAEDYHFLHQNAKCYLNYAYKLKNDEEKEKYLDDAFRLARISLAMIRDEYERKHNERLQISAAHAQYTVATVKSEICLITKFADNEEVEKTIDEICEAVYSPYNDDDYKKERKGRKKAGIYGFILYAASNDIRISKEYRGKLDELITLTIH